MTNTVERENGVGEQGSSPVGSEVTVPANGAAQSTGVRPDGTLVNEGSNEGSEVMRISALARIAAIAAMIILLTTSSTYLYAQAQTSEHVAEVNMLIELGRYGSQAQADRELETLAIIATSPVVLDGVAEDTGLPSGTLRTAVSADAIGSSAVMSLRATHSDRDTALAIVTRTGERFQELLRVESSAATQRSIQAEIDDLAERLSQIDDQLAAIAAEKGDSPDEELLIGATTAAELRLLSESEEVIRRVSVLEDRLLDLGLEGSVEKATALGEPRVVGEEASLPPKQAIAVGGFIGLLLAAVAGAILWQLWSPDEPSEPVEPADVANGAANEEELLGAE